MIGLTIEARPPRHWLTTVSLAATACLLVVSLAGGGVACLLAAALPALLAGLQLLAQPRRVALEVTDQGLQVVPAGPLLRYAELRDAWFGPLPAREAAANDAGAGLIWLSTGSAETILPDRLSVPRRKFAAFLTEQAGEPTTPSPPASLRDYVDEQTAKFGHDQVLLLAQRRSPPVQSHARLLARIGVASFISGLFWIVATQGFKLVESEAASEALTGAAGFAMLVGFLCLMFALLMSQRHRKEMEIRNACLVITPAGLALTQGELRGVLRWEEITGIEAFARTERGKRPGSTLRVAGGRIPLPDIYQESAATIRRLIHERRGVTSRG